MSTGTDVITVVGNILAGLEPVLVSAIQSGNVSTLDAVQAILPNADTQKARDLALQNQLDKEAHDQLDSNG